MIQLSKILKSVPIFHTLGKESIDFIIQRLKFKTFGPDETVCKIGDPGDEMYIIINGKVKICIYDEQGNEKVVATLKGGDYFGEMALLTGEPRSASVITMEESEMFALHKNDFDLILEKFPSISISIGKIMSQRLRETLAKASNLPNMNKIETGQEGPKGNLQDVPLVDLIRFCEANSITGVVKLKHNDHQGQLEFRAGQLQKVMLEDLSEDQALDTMLGWQEGQFQIKLKPLKLDELVEGKTSSAEELKIKNILIMSNSLVVQKIIERALLGLGYNVFKSRNINDGIDLLNKENIHLIVSDIKLPDGEGQHLIETVRSETNDPIILLGEPNMKDEVLNAIKNTSDVEVTQSHEVSEIVQLIEHFNQNE